MNKKTLNELIKAYDHLYNAVNFSGYDIDLEMILDLFEEKLKENNLKAILNQRTQKFKIKEV